MSFRIKLTRVFDGEFLFILLGLFLDSLGPLTRPLANFLKSLMTVFRDFLRILEFESLIPLLLVEVEQHLCFKFVGLVVDIDGIVVFVQSLVHCLDGGFVQVTVDGGRLSRLLTAHRGERVDQSESVDDHLASD